MSDELTPLIRDLISPEVRFNMRIFHALEGMMGSQLAGTIPFGELRQFAEAFLAAGDDRRTPQEAAQPELVAEVVRDDEEGVQYVQWFKPRELFPVGTQFYTSPSSLSQEDRELMEMAAEALDMAHTGLKWYRDHSPSVVDGSDDEADDEINGAISLLRTRLQAPAPTLGAPGGAPGQATEGRNG